MKYIFVSKFVSEIVFTGTHVLSLGDCGFKSSDSSVQLFEFKGLVPPTQLYTWVNDLPLGPHSFFFF